MGSPNAWVFSITALAVALAEGRSDDDVALLGLAFTQLGDTLATICQTRGSEQTETNEQNARQPAQNEYEL